MTYYAGFDVSLRTVNICIIDDQGEYVTETKVMCIKLAMKTPGTNVVPGSHKWTDPKRRPDPDEIAYATMSAGSAVFIPGHTLHGGGANENGVIRRAIVASYVLGWLRTQENHFLHTTVDQVATLPDRVRQLLGYDLYAHYDENISGGPLGYYEYKSPSVLFE